MIEDEGTDYNQCSSEMIPATEPIIQPKQTAGRKSNILFVHHLTSIQNQTQPTIDQQQASFLNSFVPQSPIGQPNPSQNNSGNNNLLFNPRLRLTPLGIKSFSDAESYQTDDGQQETPSPSNFGDGTFSASDITPVGSQMDFEPRSGTEEQVTPTICDDETAAFLSMLAGTPAKPFGAASQQEVMNLLTKTMANCSPMQVQIPQVHQRLTGNAQSHLDELTQNAQIQQQPLQQLLQQEDEEEG